MYAVVFHRLRMVSDIAQDTHVAGILDDQPNLEEIVGFDTPSPGRFNRLERTRRRGGYRHQQADIARRRCQETFVVVQFSFHGIDCTRRSGRYFTATMIVLEKHRDWG